MRANYFILIFMNETLFVAGIQASLFWENSIKNREYFESKINSLPLNIDLVVLPEMFTSGFTMNAENVAEKMNGNTISWMQKLASKNNFAIAGSLVIEENSNFYNRFVFVHPSREIDFYDKHHTFTLAGEDKIYTSGNEKTIIAVINGLNCNPNNVVKSSCKQIQRIAFT